MLVVMQSSENIQHTRDIAGITKERNKRFRHEISALHNITAFHNSPWQLDNDAGVWHVGNSGVQEGTMHHPCYMHDPLELLTISHPLWGASEPTFIVRQLTTGAILSLGLTMGRFNVSLRALYVGSLHMAAITTYFRWGGANSADTNSSCTP